MFRRLLGILMVGTGMIGFISSVAGIVIGLQVIDAIGTGIQSNLLITSQSLDTVEDTLLLAKATISDVNTSLETVEMSADDLGRTINDTRPLVDRVTGIASEEVPNSIEAVQASIPNMVAVAGVIDETLTTLNNFRIDESILGLRLQYDLGVDYDPEVPFDESVMALGESLEGLPETLRTLRVYLNVTNENLATISQGLFNVADDLDTVNGRISEIEPLLDEYIRIVSETNDNTRQLRAQVDYQLARARLVLVALMIWLVLAQAVPLYLGWELLTGRRGTVVVRET